jgi:hypothetical protein
MATEPRLMLNVPVSRQLLMDLLCTAVEGGSNYWAAFRSIERTTDLDYLRVRVIELEASGDQRVDRVVAAEDLRLGLERLAAATFASAGKHFGDAICENGDAITADVVLQMTVFGDVVYG